VRVTGILVVLALIAFVIDCKPLGALVLLFIIGCALFGLAQGGAFDISEQRKRLWRDNPEHVIRGFEAWKAKKKVRDSEEVQTKIRRQNHGSIS
jgi:hypothetical protein